MALHDKNLPKNSWDKFQDIESIIGPEVNHKKLADIIAKYREDITEVLKLNEAEWSNDENDLKNLIDKLEIEKKPILRNNLWKDGPCHTNFTDNTDVITFWENVISLWINDKPPHPPAGPLASTSDKNTLKVDIENAIKNIQLLHDNRKWDQQNWQLFGWKTANIIKIGKTIGDTKIQELLNVGNRADVKAKVKQFINSVTSTWGNPFYIQGGKLNDLDERQISIRIAWYLYLVWRIIDKNYLTQNLHDQIRKTLDEQIVPFEIPNIKWLHNTKVELWYLEPEYETLKDLNAKAWDVDLWEKDLWGWSITETRDLKADFESWIAVNIEKYSIDASDIEIKDNSGNPIPVILSDWLLDFSNLSAGEHVRLSSDILLDIWWKRLKIWRIFLDNDTLHQLVIKFDDETTIKSAATTSSLTLPSFPLDFSFKLKWRKKVSNGLEDCYASLTKKYFSKLKLWGLTPPVILDAQRERETTISNVEQVNRAIAEREAEEELRERYKNIWWNVLDRANLFLRRNFIKDKLIYKKMWWKKDEFDIDWRESGQSAAHRHQIENKENLADGLEALVNIDADNYPETRDRLNKLIDDFTWKTSIPPWTWGIDPANFKIKFEEILKWSGESFDTAEPITSTIPNRKRINEIIKSNKIQSLSTNIMMQAKQFQAHQRLVYNIREHIIANPGESDHVFDVWCRGKIGSYINTYDDIPDFLEQMGLSLDNAGDIKTLKANDAALNAIQAQSLKYRLQILDGWSEAYNVKKRWRLLTKIGRIMDDPTENIKFFNEHPHLKEAFWWIRWGTKMGLMIAPWLLLAPAGTLAVASWVGGMAAITTFFKKKSHYEKENRSYQKMQATNLTDYRNKRTALANEIAWMKWYEGRFRWKNNRNRKQFNDYILTTQDQLLSTNELVTNIKTYLKKWNVLNVWEKDNLGKLLADWLARLDYHKETGQNFLWSDNPDNAEKEYKQLQNAIIWWSLRLKITDLEKLRTDPTYAAYYNATKDLIDNWTWNEYNNQWYLKAKKRFGRRSYLKAWWWAVKAWAVSFILSFLASSLASKNHPTTEVVQTSDASSSWKIWWEYNLWDWQEHLFTSWDVNPTMNSVINNSTSEITWGTLYSSVDAAHCSARFWAEQLAQAERDLAQALWNSTISWNSNLVSAINNYVADATTKIWQISWLSAGNHDLAIARAIEAAKEWILEPIIASNNTMINIDPTCLTWVDPWTIQSTWGAIGEAFRNMWIMNIDVIQSWTKEIVHNATRAIAIPIPWRSNTFWEPKSKVA